MANGERMDKRDKVSKIVGRRMLKSMAEFVCCGALPGCAPPYITVCFNLSVKGKFVNKLPKKEGEMFGFL